MKSPPSSSSAKGSPAAPGGMNATPGTAPTDVVRPVVPPLYPPARKAPPGRQIFSAYAKVYLELQEYYRSNFTVEYIKKKRCAFNVERYTDKYNKPQSIDPNLSVPIDSNRLPKELYAKNIKIVRKKQMTELDAKRKLEELSTRFKDEVEGAPVADDSDTDEPKSKKRKVDDDEGDGKEGEDALAVDKPDVNEDDEEEEEVDEELDEGTDYMANYFDNGEDYLDEEDDALDDGAVF